MNKFKKQLSIIMTFAFLLTGITLNMVESQAAVKLNKKSISIKVGKTYKLKIKGTKKKVKWSTSNKKVAIVSSKGVVKGKKAGKATITAKVGKKKYKCKVKVTTAKKITTSPVPTQTPSNVDTNSTDALAAGCSVAVEKIPWSGDLLFTVTNTNKQMVDTIKIKYVMKNAQGKVLGTDNFLLCAIEAGQSKQYAALVDDTFGQEVDASKIEMSKTVEKRTYGKYEDMTSQISVSTEKTEKGNIVYTMKNNGTQDAYGQINFYFYDSDGKLLYAVTETINLSPDQTKKKSVFFPYVYNDDGDEEKLEYATMDYKVQAFG